MHKQDQKSGWIKIKSFFTELIFNISLHVITQDDESSFSLSNTDLIPSKLFEANRTASIQVPHLVIIGSEAKEHLGELNKLCF